MGRRPRKTTVMATASPALIVPGAVGGGWVRTDLSFTQGYTIKNAKTDFGANNVLGDGSDETTKINAILTAAAAGQAVYFPAGTYGYSALLGVYGKTNIIVYGDGPGLTVFQALDKTASTFLLDHWANVRICDLKVTCPTASVRNNVGYQRRGFYLATCSGITFNNAEVNKVENAGILMVGCSTVRIDSSKVDTSYADGFHATYGSSNITIQNCWGKDNGDDSFASIGEAATGLNTAVAFFDNLSTDSAASGLSFEGTNGGTGARNRVYRSGVAGCRIDTPTSYAIGATDAIDCRGNYFEGVRTNTSIDHAAVMIFAQYSYVHGVVFSDNTIVNPNTSTGIRVFGTSAPLNVTATINSNVMLNTTGLMTTGFNIDATYATVSKSGNTLNGAAV